MIVLLHLIILDHMILYFFIYSSSVVLIVNFLKEDYFSPFPQTSNYFGKDQRASQVVLVVQNLLANAGRCKRHGFDPWVGKIPWRRAQQLTPVFSPGESHGQRSLTGYTPKSQTQLKRLSTSTEKQKLKNKYTSDLYSIFLKN